MAVGRFSENSKKIGVFAKTMVHIFGKKRDNRIGGSGMDIVGRKNEIAKLQSCLNSSQSRLMVVSGRRRVGKTFLIDEAYSGRMLFRHTAQSPEALLSEKSPAKTIMDAQISRFLHALKRAGHACKESVKNWDEAFFELEKYVESAYAPEKNVIFLDELPWLDTPNSGFFPAFMGFWSDFVLPHKGLVLAVAGSANSWILDKLVENTGSLYKRHHCWINLLPFTLGETEEFFLRKGIRLSRYDITVLYMAFGGIPYYLDLVEKGKSVAQNLAAIFSSSPEGLDKEFDSLFRSIFSNPELMISLVRAIGSKRSGIDKSEITRLTGLPDGGTMTDYLRALMRSGFIEAYRPFGAKTAAMRYRIIDPFTLFYLRFMEKEGPKALSLLTGSLSSSKLNAWKGISFEVVCFQHIRQIKKALGVEGVISEESLYYEKGEEVGKGAQIDMLIKREDNILNLVEAKFTSGKYAADATDQSALNRKAEAIAAHLPKRFSIHYTLITTYGLAEGSYDSVFDNVITLDDLFQ